MKHSTLICVVALVAACAVDRTGLNLGADAGGLDANGLDAHLDAHLDAPGLDAPGMDAPPMDAPPMDAPPVDSAVDALDTGVDAPPRDGGCRIGDRYCAEPTILECTEGGLVVVAECPLGCATTGETCRRLDVSNVDDDAALFRGTASLTVRAGESVELNSSDGGIRETGTGTVIRAPGDGLIDGMHFGSEEQGDAPKLAIFAFDQILVEDGGRLVAVGGAAVVLLATQAIINGTIDLSASGRSPGPGGGLGGVDRSDGFGLGAGERGHLGGAFDGLGGGGGGGGHGAAGGNGGDERDCCGGRGSGGTGGAAIDDALAVPLVGGGGGGSGAPADGGGHGGGGGGGLQITTSGFITVGPTGVIDVGGAGGDGDDDSGGGGGAGGSVLLESPSVSVMGWVVANGGGGGGGHENFGSSGPGEHAVRDVRRAAGGSGDARGGSGGAFDDLAGENGGQGDHGGGGGGAAGRIRWHTSSGTVTGTPQTSPAPTAGTILIEG